MKYATLVWVKPAIDDLVKQIRQSLEQFVENPEDPASLQDAVGWLHEVHGSLFVLDISSAAQLVREMEVLTSDLIAGKVGHKEHAYDILLQALLQLPNYLDHLALGYVEMPVALLPLINKMRALRAQPPLDNSTMFYPNLQISLPLKPAPKLPDLKLKEFVHKLRPAYQKGLILWIKGPNRGEGLKLLHTVLERMLQATGHLPISKLWLSGSAIIEAILQKGIAPNNAITNHLKQLDGYLKQIVDHGNPGIHIQPPAALLNQMLYYVAHAKSTGPRVSLIKKIFELESHLPNEQELRAAQQLFSGPDIEMINTVVTAIMEDFARVEETLDIFARADEPDVNDLVPIIDILMAMAYTLDVLGLDAQSKSLKEQAATIQRMTKNELHHELAQLLSIADALMKVNTALETLAHRGVHARQQIQKETGLQETQVLLVLKAAVIEAKTELTEMIPIINAFFDSGKASDELADLPNRFTQLQGLMYMNNREKAAQLTAHCSRYVAEVLIKQAKVPEEAKRKALADTIISLDLYLDTLAGTPLDGNQILETTNRCIHALFAAPKAA